MDDQSYELNQEKNDMEEVIELVDGEQHPGFEEYEGEGIAHKFIQFQKWNLDVTIGNFYDQFGSGVLFRSYFDPNLGVDNSVIAVRVINTKTGNYAFGEVDGDGNWQTIGV